MRQYFRVTLKSAGGDPLAGEAVMVTLRGDGSLAPGFDAKEAARETNDSGIVPLCWYRRGIFTRDAKAVLSVAASRADASVTIEPVDSEEMAATAGPWISWAPQRRRF